MPQEGGREETVDAHAQSSLEKKTFIIFYLFYGEINLSYLFLQNLLQLRPPLLEFFRRDVRDGQNEAVARAQKVDL